MTLPAPAAPLPAPFFRRDNGQDTCNPPDTSQMKMVTEPLHSLLHRLHRLRIGRLPSNCFPSSSSLPSLEAISARLPSSRQIDREARRHLQMALALFRMTSDRSRNVLTTARKREARYVKLVERWYPTISGGWAAFEQQTYLLTGGTLRGDLLKGTVAGLLTLLCLLVLLTVRRYAYTGPSHERTPSLLSALSKTESSASGSDSSYTSDESDQNLLDLPPMSLRRPTSPLGRTSASPSARGSRHFAVGSASKRADRRSTLIRITSSDPTSSLCRMPVELDLLSPTGSSFNHLQSARSASPSQAAALAVLKRRKKRLGISTSTVDELDLGAEVAALLSREFESSERGADAAELEDNDPSTSNADADDVDGHHTRQARLAAASTLLRNSSPLGRPVRNRPPLRVKRTESPLPNETPGTIPERNSSNHKLNGVMQDNRPRVVGGDRMDAPPSILRKKSQFWTEAVQEGNESGANMLRSGSRSSTNEKIVEAETLSISRSGSRKSNEEKKPYAEAASTTEVKIASQDPQQASATISSNVEAWRSKFHVTSGSHPSHLSEHKVKRLRAVKLTEPDWAQYVTIHERARERMEKKKENERLKKAKLASNNTGPGGGRKNWFSGSSGSVKRRESVKRRQQEARFSHKTNGNDNDNNEAARLDWVASPLHTFTLEDVTEPNLNKAGSQRMSSVSGSTTPRRRGSNGSQHQSLRLGISTLSSANQGNDDQPEGGKGTDEADAESDFWFERYIPSTAAAGKDWDWRKRRAHARVKSETEHSSQSVENLYNEVKEEGKDQQSYTIDCYGRGQEIGPDVGKGGTRAGGGEGKYVINGHEFSHGLVGSQLGYPNGVTSPLSSSSGSPKRSPAVGGGGPVKVSRRK